MRGFQTFNPHLNDFNSTIYYSSSVEEVEFALQKLQEATLTFSNSTAIQRSQLLKEISIELSTNKQVIQSFYCNESGLSKERFETEFSRTLHQLASFSNFLEYEWEKLEIFTNTFENSPSLRRKKVAIGPVLVMGSSNFPLAYSTIGGDSVASLAAGCPVVVKAHPMHVGTSLEVANCVFRAISKLELNEGIFQHLIDDGLEIAKQLINDTRIKAVGFTGSIKGGRALMDLASARKSPIPVFAEMGSANPVVFLEHGFEDKMEYFTTIFAQAVCMDAGQFCTKPGLIFIPKTIKGDELTSFLIQKVLNQSAFYMLHPNIKNNFERLKKERASISPNSFYESTKILHDMQGRQAVLEIDSDFFLKHVQLQEEVFGPFTLIIRYFEFEDLENCLLSLDGQLTGSLIADRTQNLHFDKIVDLLASKVGRLILNGIPTGVRVDQAMNHGGPYPASSDSRFTAVGTQSIYRFLRNVTFQDFDLVF